MTLKDIGRSIYYAFKTKHSAELGYWRKCFQNENRVFENAHYKRLMLAIAQEKDDAFLHGKIVADFGCGPRGSLSWISSAAMKIGIDVLIPQYLRYFHTAMKTHAMVYLTSTETHIPLPDDSVDIVFVINALDHVSDLACTCGELSRIIKPGGELIGSFNLCYHPTKAEPQSLTEQLLKKYLLPAFEIKSCRISG
ncbi:MAG: class I SAM-dependent methyltransferase, partial [Candidatus Cloacimonadaceae bacterium]|nr:class I SAM-dependent methyltransferase [Candidatus Cloacimonadaceae bacterium]